MKANSQSIGLSTRFFWILMAGMLSISFMAQGVVKKEKRVFEEGTYKEIKGKVVDANSGDDLVFANVTIEGTNIATVTNSEGSFALKVPNEMLNKNMTFSYIGYEKKSVPIASLKDDKNKIKLELLTVSLDAITVFPKDPNLLIEAVLNHRKDNYSQDENKMTAFYRETIRKRRNYASLSEAVVEVYKQGYSNHKDDAVKLLKGRKSVDYSKLDTVLFKLQGGPYSTLMLDIMKSPYMILRYDLLDQYDFEIANITRQDDRILYILNFKQKDWVPEPLFYGSLYIDSETMAIVSASYNVNTEDKRAVGEMFIKRKPAGADVYPTKASYLVTYREKDGKWIYGYSRGEITFKVDWKKKWFNTVYHTGIEMAITDWERTSEKAFKGTERLKKSVVMSDTEMGFADADFWGAYNVIEPEKSIESAIKKIQKNIEKLDN
ncbi:carboxypeptidase-like regulatory domain-containing protein [Carboxylicivirga mesophila]|uniref:Carboxypeptidase-like regulatory domain-containing protein n=1 Tax=Carboxylicivirga mesophila TaxID=1166478 RepID=A0ABS5KA23_9BACT|nr:carboxypeptidase-like regulatory domain-containing protein [Carboxylicivirga mesophila]MBS2211796.1 carboxypeptidase-like regulatory domain-containing protein [Carboxylicivirga mesophila]